MSLKSSCSIRREAYHGVVVNSGQLSKYEYTESMQWKLQWIIKYIIFFIATTHSSWLAIVVVVHVNFQSTSMQDYEQGLKYTKCTLCVGLIIYVTDGQLIRLSRRVKNINDDDEEE
ncbi:hypothetical protein T05_1129 [Trichinella murrelli]|uniref:Transmembrane protein n=1 Tax=Trichinella murrelli TaxID=144512 RepID=A0A0V0U4V4_9BILA|nr:hypothetical protein T05_3437 [Trichinella murrelli]KRX45764.1 hypothetical protein T05_1129 [Trichinella murrelli]